MTILTFLLVLFTLILVHEFGHFIVAKWFNIRVDEFALGFPPRLFSVKKGETEYAFNLLPIGGYVRIFGEDPTVESLHGPEANRSLANAPKYVQALVMLAGVTMNIVLAWAIFTLGFIIGIPSAVPDDPRAIVEDRAVIITSVVPDSPADLSGMKQGDTLLAIHQNNIPSPINESSTVIPLLQLSNGNPLLLTVLRDREEQTIEINPVQGLIPDNPELYGIGIIMSDTGVVSYPWYMAPTQAFLLTKDLTVAVGSGILSFIGNALTFDATLSDISGPVGIATLLGDAASEGFMYVFQFAALISINLAVINLLPFPALDGGRLVLVGIETLTRTRINTKVANVVNGAGIVFLLLLMAVITVSDVLKLL